MAISSETLEKLDIGKVFQLAVSVGQKHAGRLAAIWGLSVLIFTLVGIVAVLAGGVSLVPQLLSGQRPSIEIIQKLWPVFGVSALILMLAGMAQQCAGLHAALAEIAGRQTTFSENLKFGVRNALPMLGLMILVVLAYMGGLILLVVPGVMMLLAFSVALPAALAEKTGVFGAFRRSRDLTRNNRWRILGLWVIVSILSWVFTSITQVASGGGQFPSNPGGWAIYLALSIIQSAIFGVAGICIYAALYAELRRIKEGVGPISMSEIFD